MHMYVQHMGKNKHYKQTHINILTYIGIIYSIITHLNQPNLSHVGPQVNKYHLTYRSLKLGK